MNGDGCYIFVVKGVFELEAVNIECGVGVFAFDGDIGEWNFGFDVLFKFVRC